MPKVVGEVWTPIMEYAGRHQVEPVGPPFMAYHNMDMEDLDLEIGLPFPKRLGGEGEMQPGELPSGKVAECLHVGPYERLAEAYDALEAWLCENRLTPSGIAYEFYPNDPTTTAQDRLETRVLFPPAKRDQDPRVGTRS